jgi:uncharacterized membrane protein YfcA
MIYALGFLIALAIGITGVGGGTITVPVLMLFVHLAPDKTVGTALAFAAAVKILVAPVYLVRKQVNYRILGLMVLGGLPGLFVGLYFLHRLHSSNQNALLTVLLGIIIVLTAVINILRVNKQAKPETTTDRSRLLPWIMLPIGAEVGFSSAGAGAIGTLALLNLTKLTPVQVVGTDVVFGLALSLLGGGIQMATGSYDPTILTQLVIGGVFGALIGPNVAVWLPSKPLRVALCLWLASLGTMLCWRAAS